MYTQLYAWENLLLAYRRAAKGKRGHANVAAFEYRLEENLLLLQQELQEHRYQPGPYSSFYIHEPKRRLISAAPFRDRIVHHALCNLLEPRFERAFIADSYANRVGKGTHRALDRAQQLARRHPYLLQIDVRQFFPSIDHSFRRPAAAGYGRLSVSGLPDLARSTPLETTQRDLLPAQVTPLTAELWRGRAGPPSIAS